MPKLVRISSSYPNYLRTFAKENPDVSRLTYVEQKARLDQDANGWADYWGSALKSLGYESNEFVLNFTSAQKKWAEERGLVEDLSPLEIIRRQILEVQPEVLFVNDYTNFSRQWITELREVCPSIRLVLGWCGAPFRDPEVFRAYDIVLSCIPELISGFRQNGHKAFHLAHAFDPRILERISDTGTDVGRAYDFTFIGQIIRHEAFHADRERILSALIAQMPIEIFSPSGKLNVKEELLLKARQHAFRLTQLLRSSGISERILANIPVLRKSAQWETFPTDPAPPTLKRAIRPPVYGLKMFRTLRNSKITFNNHIGISSGSASNMRLFEATGVGTCLLTDWKDDLHRYFKEDDEVVTFRTADECLEKAKWLLSHPNEMAEIGMRGQKRTLSEHSFSDRAIILDRYIREALK